MIQLAKDLYNFTRLQGLTGCVGRRISRFRKGIKGKWPRNKVCRRRTLTFLRQSTVNMLEEE